VLNASVSRLHRVLFTFNGGYHFLDVIRTRSGRGRLCDRDLSVSGCLYRLVVNPICRSVCLYVGRWVCRSISSVCTPIMLFGVVGWVRWWMTFNGGDHGMGTPQLEGANLGEGIGL